MNTNSPLKTSFRNHITHALQDYFSTLDGESAKDIYQLVLCEVEKPLLEIVMQQTHGNQSRAAQWLGLNRGTLRKLLTKYKLL